MMGCVSLGRRVALAALLLGLAACRGLSDEKAVGLVQAYNRRIVEAYRTSDHQIAALVASPREIKKLAGLIGVKYDRGMALDAELLELKVLGIERREGAVVVRTDERWHYLDRRIGTGSQVGRDSNDHYVMRYFLRPVEGRWVVDAVEWAEPPQVGRVEAPIRGDAQVLHGVRSPTSAGEATSGPGEGGRADR